jgi:Leucine-rich repeat (LRR) protein
MFTPETLAQQQAPLQRINLSANLHEFPADLYRFADSVEILDLSGNQLSDLPADLFRFKKLKRLFLTNNKFCHIPAVLSACPELVMLSFKGNQLTEFAEGCLPEQLEWLILTDNQLTALPADIGRYAK